MIGKLRRRMTLMVIAVLIIVSAGIVLAIRLANERNIAVQAEDTLAVLAENGGANARKDNPPVGGHCQTRSITPSVTQMVPSSTSPNRLVQGLALK